RNTLCSDITGFQPLLLEEALSFPQVVRNRDHLAVTDGDKPLRVRAGKLRQMLIPPRPLPPGCLPHFRGRLRYVNRHDSLPFQQGMPAFGLRGCLSKRLSKPSARSSLAGDSLIVAHCGGAAVKHFRRATPAGASSGSRLVLAAAVLWGTTGTAQ